MAKSPKKKAAPKGGGKAASGYNLYTPVSQNTIDKIKKMGMTKALKKAGSSSNAEFLQGVKRMYGANRLKAAKAAVKPVAKSPDAARAMASKGVAKKSVAKSPDAARAASMGSTKAKAPTAKSTNWRSAGVLPALRARKKVGGQKVVGPGYFKS